MARISKNNDLTAAVSKNATSVIFLLVLIVLCSTTFNIGFTKGEKDTIDRLLKEMHVCQTQPTLTVSTKEGKESVEIICK